jgi:hypothetical protein
MPTPPNDETLHARQMNINSHFAWALAMWASAESAHQQKNTLLAAVGYYYSAFHAGFAAANTNLDIPPENLVRITHAKLKEYLEPMFPGFGGMYSYELLQGVREAVNYLGADGPTGKLRIVRGNGFGFDEGGGVRYSFERALERAHQHSLIFLRAALVRIESFCSTHRVTGPKSGDSYWIEEYIDEDFLLGVIPREAEGLKIVARASALLMRELLPQLGTTVTPDAANRGGQGNAGS